jgi:hypothetical protein
MLDAHLRASSRENEADWRPAEVLNIIRLNRHLLSYVMKLQYRSSLIIK